eukprot:1828665-Amphidinium_carterae.1
MSTSCYWFGFVPQQLLEFEEGCLRTLPCCLYDINALASSCDERHCSHGTSISKLGHLKAISQIEARVCNGLHVSVERERASK